VRYFHDKSIAVAAETAAVKWWQIVEIRLTMSDVSLAMH